MTIPSRGVLVLHGFTGTPFEVRPLAERLTRDGFQVHTPLLAGHGGDMAALEATSWRDWLDSAAQSFDALATRVSGPVAIVGFSMGGLLALRLALARPTRVSALAILAAPLNLRATQVRAIRLLARLPAVLRRGPFRAVPKLFGADVSDRQLRRRVPGQPAMPLVGLVSLLQLMELVRSELAGVAALEIPIMVAHGRHDRAVPIDDSIELAQRLSGERVWLEHSRHLIGIDVEHEQLGDALATFLRTRGRWSGREP